MSKRISVLLFIFFSSLWLILSHWFWKSTNLFFSFLLPAALILAFVIVASAYHYLVKSQRREHLKEMFGQYVPETHIDEMLKSRSNYGLHGEDREMSVLFADIRNFTSISEGMRASELVTMLNTFFTPMTEVLFNHHGTIDKYVGDLIMAFWGAPLKNEHHRRDAIQAALAMQKKLKEISLQLAAHEWPEIKIGIGINSGIMSVGDMGSRFRRNYTVLGDAVNLASRIEGLTKFYGVEIIVTENVMRHQTRFIFRQLDRVRVKGKKTSIAIYEVMCTATELTPPLNEELKQYHTALDHYFAQQWDHAYTLMTQLQIHFPDKKIYRLYVDRIIEFKQAALPEDWDGVYVHVAK